MSEQWVSSWEAANVAKTYRANRGFTWSQGHQVGVNAGRGHYGRVTTGISSTVDVEQNFVAAEVSEFSGEATFALLGETYALYLPTTRK